MTRLRRSQITGMNFHYIRYPFAHFLEAMVRYGIDRIELWGASPHFYVEEASPADIKRIRREIESRGLKLVCFTPEQCVYPINIAAEEGAIRERSVAYFIKSLEAAAELGAPLLLVTSGWGYFSAPVGEAWKRSRESLERLTQHAEQLGVTLVLEPLRPEESNLVTNLPTLARMLAEVRSPCLKGMVDTVPLAIAGEELQAYFDRLKSDLVHIHFIDGRPGGHLAWGDGHLPLENYLETLEKNGYTDSLTLEFTSDRYVTAPDQAIEQTLRTLQPYFH
ncbi:sugar phosphate isomerase/epimerase family protein [Brevibacillus sp. B_LB10_24]|uniref:sugar phosphate isomerase/epimerase family protein n=1 Tax=Brevibacillus sp. B_LB10_24 TaxID=3380645 RepID=UPI0038B8E439